MSSALYIDTRAANTVAAHPGTRWDRIEHLRRNIRAIERRSPVPLQAEDEMEGVQPRSQATACRAHAVWTFGDPDIDARVGLGGLEKAAVHEIKPDLAAGVGEAAAGWAALWSVARAFALRLAVRRLAADISCSAPVLWCVSAAETAEFGMPYGPGLRALGLPPERLIVVVPSPAADVPWVLEEALKSAAVSLVLGQIAELDLTPARRLALAAAASHTPCLLITHPRAMTTAATATRWRIGPAPSAQHPFDPRASGAPRFAMALERCRSHPQSAGTGAIEVEWSDAASCFRMVAAVADRAHAPGKSTGALATGRRLVASGQGGIQVRP